MRYAVDGYAVLGYFLQNETQCLASITLTGSRQLSCPVSD